MFHSLFLWKSYSLSGAPSDHRNWFADTDRRWLLAGRRRTWCWVGMRPRKRPMRSLLCCSTRTLACFILVNASKLRFKGSYSDKLHSPHKLKFAGTPKRWVLILGSTKKESENSPFVAQPGLEPRQTEPESVVLPLHHWAMRFCLATRAR